MSGISIRSITIRRTIWAPDGAVAEETFRVVRDAMQREKKVALARIVLSSRERLIAIAVRDKGFVVNTLRAEREVRGHEECFKDITNGAVDDDMLELAKQLIEQKSGKFDLSDYEDKYEAALLDVVKAKINGEEPVVAKAPERGQVINLMDALKRSLDDGGQKPPAPSKARKAAGQNAGKKKKQAGGRK